MLPIYCLGSGGRGSLQYVAEFLKLHFMFCGILSANERYCVDHYILNWIAQLNYNETPGTPLPNIMDK